MIAAHASLPSQDAVPIWISGRLKMDPNPGGDWNPGRGSIPSDLYIYIHAVCIYIYTYIYIEYL